MRRADFLAGSAASTITARETIGAASRSPFYVLILSGGGAFGAYEAGVVSALPRFGIDYDVVCGTSIGALNAYMIATAQYTRLRDLWLNLAQYQLTALESPYNKIRDVSSGILNRLAAALKLSQSFSTNLQGLLEEERVWKLLDANVDPRTPVHLPL